MNIKNFFYKNIELKNKDIVTIKDGIIPDDKISINENTAFIICSKDERVINSSIQSICDLNKDNKDVTIIISSSYEKLHKLTNGAL